MAEKSNPHTKEEIAELQREHKERKSQELTQEELQEMATQMVGAIVSFGDLRACYHELKEILAKTAFVNGSSQRITTPIWEDLSPMDTKDLLGAYYANFIVGSLIQ